MIFGDHVRAPVSSAAAEPITRACRGSWWTVGWFLPNDYATYIRVPAPHPDVDDWWTAYRSLFDIVATAGTKHTSSPDRAWFAVWAGYGWDTSATFCAVQGPLDDAGRREMRQEQVRLRAEDARRHTMVRAGLSEIPRFELPNRSYYLLEGPVAAVTGLLEPGSPERWQRPDLFWPDDRTWLVATDVDFWSLYVGGTPDFIAELTDAVPTSVEAVTLDDPLEAED